MQTGDRVKFIKDRLYNDLKIRREQALIVERVWKYVCLVVGVKYAPAHLAGIECSMIVSRNNLRSI
jgi:hypothetical protein